MHTGMNQMSVLRSRHLCRKLRHRLRKYKVPESTLAPTKLGRLRHRLRLQAALTPES